MKPEFYKPICKTAFNLRQRWGWRFCRLMILLIVSSGLAIQVEAQMPVQIHLRSPNVRCSEQIVRIGDIADVSGGNRTTRQEITQLDLESFTAEKRTAQIASLQIRYRIQLAGFRSDDFQISGESQVLVQKTEPVPINAKIEKSICQQIASQYQIPESELEVSIDRQLDQVVAQAGLNEHITVAASLPVELPIGNQNVEIVLTDSNQQSHKTRVQVRLAVYRDLVMVQKNISRGELLTDKNIKRVRRAIDNSRIQFASYEQVIGKQAQNNIQQFSLVKSQSVRSPAGNHQTAVKRDSRLNVIIKQGPLLVTLKGARALEAGNVGDYIDLHNPKSKKRVRARILDAATALIEM